MGSTEELRRLAREHPEDFESVAERIGGIVEDRMLRMLEEETDYERPTEEEEAIAW